VPPRLPRFNPHEPVKLDVSVLDKHGEFAVGLEQNDFRVLDNGIEQPLIFFAPVEAPAQILVLIETSPAVYLIETSTCLPPTHCSTAWRRTTKLRSYIRSGAACLASLDADKRALLAALTQVQFTMGIADLNLYDSVSTALDWLEPATGKKRGVL